MKNILIAALLCAIATNLKAQNTFPYPASGNVGIGTTNPQATLDVNGAIAMSGTVIHSTHNIPMPSDGTYVLASGARVKGLYTLSIEGPDRVQLVTLLASGAQYDGNSSITVLGNNSYVNAPVMSNFRFMLSPDHSNIYLIFDVANRNGGTPDIMAHFEGNGTYGPNWGGVLPASSELVGYYPFAVNMGKVGIGTINPGFKLDVQPDPNARFVVTSPDAAHPTIGFMDVAGNPQYGTIKAYDMLITNGATDFMKITSSGNVGIGTTSPAEKFTVNGNIKALLDPSYFQSINTAGIVSLGLSGITGARNWTIRGVYQYGNGVGQNSDGGDLDIIKSLDGNTILGTKTDGTALGNVGIGTTTPDAKLAVNGNIHAKAVKVDLIGWPDHVFKPTYSLRPLSEVRTYISQNHHLPDVPSEKEVADKGLDLGEMNKQLLKKVEELTLYLIKQQDDIEQLKLKVNALSKK